MLHNIEIVVQNCMTNEVTSKSQLRDCGVESAVKLKQLQQKEMYSLLMCPSIKRPQMLS